MQTAIKVSEIKPGFVIEVDGGILTVVLPQTLLPELLQPRLIGPV